jgi:hypothetical protein
MIMMRKRVVSKEVVQLLIYLNAEKQLPSDLAEAGQVEWLVETNSGTPLSQQATSSVLVLALFPVFGPGWSDRARLGSVFTPRKKTYRARSRGLPRDEVSLMSSLCRFRTPIIWRVLRTSRQDSSTFRKGISMSVGR